MMPMTSTTVHEVPILPNEILEDIFLCLDAAADVVWAFVACKSHRRVVCNHRFLCRDQIEPAVPLQPLPCSLRIKLAVLPRHLTRRRWISCDSSR
ncbi:hypothetical protein BDA96_08G186700 [Sorghum bicolor]|uniref:F-box domain-containing protein n=2 Tax=Sorghum bicolor TaxID=4558 RepID=A0A921QIZ8_SORBI|nr:hypothetical protein BDA96_08G186700 [Sorghum bicolor]OQU79599.1 hypothetical protein SORBI_3008G168650 [Sorghum bicolor]